MAREMVEGSRQSVDSVNFLLRQKQTCSALVFEVIGRGLRVVGRDSEDSKETPEDAPP